MFWPAILTTLRLTVVLQCIGNWYWLTQIQETSLLHWLLNPPDVGGLGWSEVAAQNTQQVIGWLVLCSAAVLSWRPTKTVLLFLAVVQTLLTTAMWRIGDGYFLEISWLPVWLLTLFPFATQLARIAAPAGLLMLVSTTSEQAEDRSKIELTMNLLRWAVAIVFLAHGLEAVQLNPAFVDLIINSMRSTLAIELTQTTAETCLFVVGIVDVLVALASVSFRFVPVLWWIAFWGALTAFSRIAAYGWAFSWHATLTRMPHFGVPLAVVLWWHLLKYDPRTKLSAGERHGEEREKQNS